MCIILDGLSAKQAMCTCVLKIICTDSKLTNNYTVQRKILSSELIISEFGEENVGEFTTANTNYFSETGIWLDEIWRTMYTSPNLPELSPTRILRYSYVQYSSRTSYKKM